MANHLCSSRKSIERYEPMQLIEAEQQLLSLHQTVLQTRDVAAFFNIDIAHASKLLDRLCRAGKFVNLMRGKWATTTKLDPLILLEYLTAPFPSYISLQTALFYHGLISQIPATIYAVSLARTHQISNHFGTFSIHHLQPELFFDFMQIDQVKIATPEKALIDILYLTPAVSKLFKSLPEIEIPDQFDVKKAKSIIKRIPSQRMQTLVENRFNTLVWQR